MTAPTIPERLRRLPELAHDLWWTWNPQAREVFRRLDYAALAADRAQPGADAAAHLAGDAEPRGRRTSGSSRVYDAAIDALDARAQRARHLVAAPLPGRARGRSPTSRAEFALHQSLPIYAGGLGVLAGDHCKEASDLGVPLIGVGFMYPQGYFHQRISPEGWQQEVVRAAELGERADRAARITPDGKPCVVAVPLGNRTVLV